MHPQSRTFAHALKLLRARDRFESELRGHLTATTSQESEIEEAISALRALGFLDDARLAARRAERLSEQKMWSRDRIRHALLESGASTDAADDAVRSLPPDAEVAGRLAVKRGRSGAALARTLQTAGFDEEVIRSLVDTDWLE